MEFTFEQRQRLEAEVLPAAIDDPEYAAATIIKLEAKLAEARAEADEQARLLGISGSKEARLQAQLAEARELLDAPVIDRPMQDPGIGWYMRRHEFLEALAGGSE